MGPVSIIIGRGLRGVEIQGSWMDWKKKQIYYIHTHIHRLAQTPHSLPHMATSRESDRDRASDPAPWFKIPNKQYICLEHPAKIKNVDRAVTTIGGERALAKVTAGVYGALSGCHLWNWRLISNTVAGRNKWRIRFRTTTSP